MEIMSSKLLVLFAAFLVSAQSVPHFGYNLPSFGYDGPSFGTESARIIAGEAAEIGEFPHQVSLMWAPHSTGGHKHFCGGTIINSQWILTAGHCAEGAPSYGSLVVKAGKHNIRKPESSEQTVDVAKKIVHKRYNGDIGPYDIALMKLEKPLSLNERVKPISLPKRGVTSPGTSILSGWGSISPNGRQLPDELQKIVLPVITIDACAKKLASIAGSSPLHSTNVCTGSTGDGGSACSGDSGGPLIKKNANGIEEVVGVVSWGLMPCGSLRAPSVYVDVAQFVDWIEDNMRNN